MPIATYFFANVCMVTENDEVVLVLTEERVAQNILVIPGGESIYKNLEQFIDTVLRRAGKEELGIELDPKKIILFDVQIGYPIEGSPYEEKGITSVIVSYMCYITEEELASIAINTVSVEGCDIVKIMVMPVPDALEAIKKGEINVYSALEATLRKLEEYFKKGD